MAKIDNFPDDIIDFSMAMFDVDLQGFEVRNAIDAVEDRGAGEMPALVEAFEELTRRFNEATRIFDLLT